MVEVAAERGEFICRPPDGLKAILLFLPFVVCLRKMSLSRSAAMGLLLGSGSKQRRMKDFASRDRDSGISGWILNIPTCNRKLVFKHFH